MKEATGELNMTVITVVAIAAVAGFFYAFIWPSVRANIALSTACSNVDARGNYSNTADDGSTTTCAKNGTDTTCTYTPESGSTQTKVCNND